MNGSVFSKVEALELVVHGCGEEGDATNVFQNLDKQRILKEGRDQRQGRGQGQGEGEGEGRSQKGRRDVPDLRTPARRKRCRGSIARSGRGEGL